VYDDLNLQHGERLLWSGKPERYPFFVSADVFAVPLSLVVLGFASLWIWNAWRWEGMPGFFVIWGIPFTLYGIYLVFGRPIVRWLRLRATSYAVTSLRVIEIVDWPRRKRTERYLRYLQPPIHRGDDMVGSVAFGDFPGLQETLQDMNFGSRWRDRPERRIVLREIAQPRHVRDIIASAQTQKA